MAEPYLDDRDGAEMSVSVIDEFRSYLGYCDKCQTTMNYTTHCLSTTFGQAQCQNSDCRCMVPLKEIVWTTPVQPEAKQ